MGWVSFSRTRNAKITIHSILYLFPILFRSWQYTFISHLCLFLFYKRHIHQNPIAASQVFISHNLRSKECCVIKKILCSCNLTSIHLFIYPLLILLSQHPVLTIWTPIFPSNILLVRLKGELTRVTVKILYFMLQWAHSVRPLVVDLWVFLRQQQCS